MRGPVSQPSGSVALFGRTVSKRRGSVPAPGGRIATHAGHVAFVTAQVTLHTVVIAPGGGRLTLIVGVAGGPQRRVHPFQVRS